MRPKKAFVFSSEDNLKIIDAALSDKAEIANNSPSSIVEAILERELLPNNPIERSLFRSIYLHAYTVQDVVRDMFSNYSAASWKNSTTYGRPLVEFARLMCVQFSSTVTMQPDLVINPIFHLRESFNMILRKLQSAQKEEQTSSGAAALQTEINRGNELANELTDENCSVVSRRIIDFFLANWEYLAGYSHVYRALMDVVDLSEQWENNATVREDFKSVLAEINRQDFFWQASEEALHQARQDTSNKFWNNKGPAIAVFQLASGQVRIPTDWRILNPENWKTAQYATVVEIRNGGDEWPRWVFFAANAVERFNTKLINGLILKDYPKYGDVLSQIVEPAYNNSGDMLPDNLEAWKHSLEPGYFDISLGGPEYASEEYRSFSMQHSW